MSDITYNTVMDVTVAWDRLKLIKEYHEKAGTLIFTRLFEIEPSARELFGFSSAEEITTANPKFVMQTKQVVDMIDCAVSFLGPDLEPLTKDLHHLGRRHKKYGVQPKHLPVMEKAVIYALEELLGNKKFTRNDRNSWQIVFHFMVMKMTEGMESDDDKLVKM